MSVPRDHLDFLQDMLDMMHTVEELTGGVSFEQFIQDQRTKLAVTKAIEIIGEAAKHVPVRVRNRYPRVPWKQMAGMRDRLTHAYFGIDFNIVWKTATELIPSLVPAVDEVLRTELRQAGSRDG